MPTTAALSLFVTGSICASASDPHTPPGAQAVILKLKT